LLGTGCVPTADEAPPPDYEVAWRPQVFDASVSPALEAGADAGLGVAPQLPLPDAAAATQHLPDAGGAGANPGGAGVDAGSAGAAADAASGTDATFAPGDAGQADAAPLEPPPTQLTFDVLTRSLDGWYAPRNIGAIWIESASGTWIKTLAVWALIRERYLTRFRAASKGNRVDAVTSATLNQHTTHHVTWDLADVNGSPVPDGEYRVVIELTDQDSTGDSTVIPFTKGPAPLELTPADVAHFVNMSLSYQ
jgi:hypothetical protein